MEITTIKLHKNTKSALDEIKDKVESYDDLIVKLISIAKNKELKIRLMEAYKNMGKKELENLKDWEVASKEIE